MNMKLDDVFKIKKENLVKKTILNDNESVTSSECSLKTEEIIIRSSLKKN